MDKLTRDAVMEALSTVEDPEIGINIVDLGLVYEVMLNELQKIAIIRITFTTPACPMIGPMIQEIEEKVKSLGFEKVDLEVVWEPPWGPEKMSEKAKMMLGIE